jgi:hypothetical protein
MPGLHAMPALQYRRFDTTVLRTFDGPLCLDVEQLVVKQIADGIGTRYSSTRRL